MFYELGMLAVGNLNRARARLAMTAGGVLVGTTAVILLIALTAGLQQAAEASIGSNSQLLELDVSPNYNFRPLDQEQQQPTEIKQLTVAEVNKFWNIPGVAVVIPITNLQSGEINAGKYTGYASIQGIDPKLLPLMSLSAQQGNLTLESGQVLLGAHVGDYFYDPKGTGDQQNVKLDLFTTAFKIKLYQYTATTPTQRNIAPKPTGVLAENDRFGNSMLMPIQDVLSYNQWITGTKIDPKKFFYDQVIIRAKSRETVAVA